MSKVISVLAPTPHQRNKYLEKLRKDEELMEKLSIKIFNFYGFSNAIEKSQYLNMFANRDKAFLSVVRLYNKCINVLKGGDYVVFILTPSPFELGLMYSQVALSTHKPTSMFESNVTFDLDACFYFAEHRGGIFDESIDKDITSLEYKLRTYKTKLTHLIEKASDYNIPLVKIKGNDKYEKFVKELGKVSLINTNTVVSEEE